MPAPTRVSIAVYCDDPSHADWSIDVLVEPDDDGLWRPVEAGLKGAGTSLRLISEDTTWTPGPSRYRYRFECGRCGVVLAVREEKMTPIFDRLAAAGRPEISVANIRRVIS